MPFASTVQLAVPYFKPSDKAGWLPDDRYQTAAVLVRITRGIFIRLQSAIHGHTLHHNRNGHNFHERGIMTARN